jgi:phenylpyruvate tautomerase PptA (4-oxalocrotonate tautomerase family)
MQRTRRFMPSTNIITGEWARGRETELIEAVQSAFHTAIKTPEWDRDIVLDFYDNSRRIVPTGKSEQYTRIEIKLFTGRSIEAKRALYKSIVANLSGLGIPQDEVKILLLEIPPQDWGIRGGVPASEVDMGYKIDV